MNLNNIKALFHKWGKEKPIFRVVDEKNSFS